MSNNTNTRSRPNHDRFVNEIVSSVAGSASARAVSKSIMMTAFGTPDDGHNVLGLEGVLKSTGTPALISRGPSSRDFKEDQCWVFTKFAVLPSLRWPLTPHNAEKQS